jgi:hypothetical protein
MRPIFRRRNFAAASEMPVSALDNLFAATQQK